MAIAPPAILLACALLPEVSLVRNQLWTPKIRQLDEYFRFSNSERRHQSVVVH